MPSVDELLNVAEVVAKGLTETNDVIEIDADTRTMIIPDTERIFGVMSDEKGERKYFRCKRFVGNGIDLSKLDLRVIYQNASGLESGKGFLINLFQDSTITTLLYLLLYHQ